MIELVSAVAELATAGVLIYLVVRWRYPHDEGDN